MRKCVGADCFQDVDEQGLIRAVTRWLLWPEPKLTASPSCDCCYRRNFGILASACFDDTAGLDTLPHCHVGRVASPRKPSTRDPSLFGAVVKFDLIFVRCLQLH